MGSMILLTSCAPVGLNNNTNAFCVAARPILITPRDVLDRGTAYDILTHNETGARLCGWQPRSVETR